MSFAGQTRPYFTMTELFWRTITSALSIAFYMIMRKWIFSLIFQRKSGGKRYSNILNLCSCSTSVMVLSQVLSFCCGLFNLRNFSSVLGLFGLNFVLHSAFVIYISCSWFLFDCVSTLLSPVYPNLFYLLCQCLLCQSVMSHCLTLSQAHAS